MVPRSPTTQGGSSSPSRVAPRTPSPRWQGNPYERPPTDAELSKNRRRNRSLARFIGILGLAMLYGFSVAPMVLLHALQQASPSLAPLSARVGWWLQVAHPFVRGAMVALLGYVLVHLLVGAGMLIRQAARRRAQVLDTMLVDLPRSPATELGRGVDLFAGLGELLSPAGRLQGREDVLVFGLVNSTADNKVRLAIRTPTRPAGQLQLSEAIRNLLTGAVPGTTTQPASDDELS